MTVNVGPSTYLQGVILEYDMYNTRSFVGGPMTNSQWNSGSEFDPWTVSGVNTNVTGTSSQGPVANAKTWKFTKTGSSSQWNGWEGSYYGIWTGSAGDVWTTSYWYKTSQPSGLTGFGIGGFYTSAWERPYNTTILANVSSIIADGNWHWNYTIVQFNEAYSNAIIADGPSWGYSATPGELYINGLQWNKNSYAGSWAAGTRSNTQALIDLAGNYPITAQSLTYSYDGSTFSYNGSTDYLSMQTISLGNGNVTWSVNCWVKTTTTVNALGQGSVLSNSSGGPVYSMMGVNNGKIVYWTYHSGWYQSLGNATVNDGNWHMLTWVNYSNYTMDMYVDGVLDASGINSTSGNNNPVDRIGGSWAGFFQGSIGMLQIYNNAMSAAQVQQNFQALKGKYGL